jgi:hypothetical protein
MGYVLAGIAIVIPLSIIAPDLYRQAPDTSLRFLESAPKSVIDLIQRIISDTSWSGSGAGTFAKVLPIYLDTSNPVFTTVAPTTAAGFVIELGRPATWIIIVAAFAVIAWLTHGALQRGRDSFFTAAGAGCAVILTLEAFVDASLSGSAIVVIAMTVLGLAVSQSVSRTAR